MRQEREWARLWESMKEMEHQKNNKMIVGVLNIPHSQLDISGSGHVQ